MTRINTNVSSLNAQKSLARSNMSLQQALTRLSTGLRINTGKDDPAGLIASEALRSDITATQVAVSNSQRANQMIATADSSLGQVSSLLNDIRGLVSEGANTGAMSTDQIAANQLQIDSSLEAIDRISQVTAFQGKRLLDGSLDFVTENVDSTKISNLTIDQANFGTQTSISVGMEVITQAEQAGLTFEGNVLASDVVLEVGGGEGFEAFTFAAGSTVTQMASAINLVSDALGITAGLGQRTAAADSAGNLTVMNGDGLNGFTVTAATAGQFTGEFTINLIKDTTESDADATWNTGTPNVIDVLVKTDAWVAAAETGRVVAGTDELTITPKFTGTAFNDISIVLTVGAGGNVVNSSDFDYTTGVFTVDVGNTTKVDLVVTALTAKYGELFTFAASATVTNITATTVAAFTDNVTAVDGGAVTATLDEVSDAIAGTTEMSAAHTDIGDDTATEAIDFITHGGYVGQVNHGDGSDASEPNNRIQITTKDSLAANLPITFQTEGASQSLNIDTAFNDRTNGYATANITSTDVIGNADAVLQVRYDTQGSAGNGITVQIIEAADDNDESVIWDQETQTLTVNVDAGTDGAGVIAARINAAVGDSFTATVIGADGGLVLTGDSAVTRDGALYDSVTVNLATDADGAVTSTAAEVVTAINALAALNTDLGITASHVTTSDGSGVAETGAITLSANGVTATNAGASGDTAARDGDEAQLTITAQTLGSAYDNVEVDFVDDATAAAEYATYDSTNKKLTFHIKEGVTTATLMVTAFNTVSGTTQAVKDLFTVAATGLTGASMLYATDSGWLENGITYAGTSNGGVDSDGNFDQGDVVGTSGLEFKSNEYGSKQFISLKALSGTFATVDADGATTDRDYGADADVRINGISAITDGLDVSLNTSVLDFSLSLASTLIGGSSLAFQIVSGGAIFQLGPDVVSNQQARMGIQSVNTAKLGGNTGRLFQLKSGGAFDLATDVKSAAKVVDQAIGAVTTLRGRLGAFQKTTVDSNIATLEDTLENLSEAESQIRDADFAAESAALTRAQILVQSGISVLSMANSNPQNVLALLR